MAKKLFIKSYGCQMNVYDSARMADVMTPHGFRPTDTPDDADLIILNTCHIREKAAEKVYSDLGRLRRHKSDRGTMIGVAGCVAQAEGDEIVRRAPQVDLVVGPQAYHRLPEMVHRALRGVGAVVDTDFPAEPKFDFLPDPAQAPGPSAFLTVQEGCDKFCSFCVVPYTRGAEYSRPAGAILAEARRLVVVGAREIVLLGQNVNAWHGDAPGGGTWGLGRLIRELASIDGLDRVRYTTSHPLDMDDELIAAHGEVPALMPFLHLPVQSGADTVLEAMNRRHRADDYYRIVDKLRAARPDLALSSDFIVGHPGETDTDFEATLDLVRRVGYAQAYSFKYSPRPGTPAAVAPRRIDEGVKAARLAALQELLNEQQRTFNEAFLGKAVPVLFESEGRRAGQLVGRSPYHQAVYVDIADAAGRAALVGGIAPVRIVRAGGNALVGTLADAPKPVETVAA